MLEDTAAHMNKTLTSVPKGAPAKEILKESSFPSARETTWYGPWNESANDVSKQSTAAVGFGICDRNDTWMNFIGQILGSLLSDGPSSPLYKELIESGLGSEYSPGTGFWMYLKDSIFAAGLQDVAEADLDAVHELVFSGLRRAQEEGFPQDRIDAILHQIELSTRHQTPKFGLNLTFGVHPGLLHGADMKDSLETLSYVKRLKEELAKKPSYLVDFIEPLFFKNQHVNKVKMIAQKEYEDIQTKMEEDLTEEKVSKLSKKEKLELLDLEMELEEEQLATPNVDCLPTLSVSDIPQEKTSFVPSQTGENTHWLQTSGSGMTYLRGMVELDGLSQREIELLPLYESVLTRIGRGEYDYRQIGVAQEGI